MNNLSRNTRMVGNVTTVQTKLMWHIEKLEEYCKLSKIESPMFTTKIGNFITKWKLELSVDNEESQDSGDDEEYLDIYLTSLNPENMTVSVKFSIISQLNREIDCLEMENKKFELEGNWGFGGFVKRKCFSCKVPKHLTIVCTMTTDEFIQVESETNKVHLQESLRLAEYEQLGKLFLTKKFSDVVIVVEGKEIHAHKNFLASKSPVFEAMFTHDMSEANNNRVEIPDVTYNSMFNMIKYIYTGIVNINFSEKMFKDLVIVSDKYCIDKLKDECEKKLPDFLAVDNIFEYLNFSEKYNAPHLKEKVIEYIVNHGEDISAMPSFNKHCSELHSNIFGEVFQALVVKRRNIN